MAVNCERFGTLGFMQFELWGAVLKGAAAFVGTGLGYLVAARHAEVRRRMVRRDLAEIRRLEEGTAERRRRLDAREGRKERRAQPIRARLAEELAQVASELGRPADLERATESRPDPEPHQP
jgi:hypothetical protein